MNKGLRFIVVGVVSTLTYLGVSLALAAMGGVDLKLANAAAYLAGMAVSYTGHRHVTFRSKGRIVSEGWKFVVTHGINLTASTALLIVLVERVGMGRLAAMVATNVFVMAVSFAILQAWVFRAGAEP